MRTLPIDPPANEAKAPTWISVPEDRVHWTEAGASIQLRSSSASVPRADASLRPRGPSRSEARWPKSMAVEGMAGLSGVGDVGVRGG